MRLWLEVEASCFLRTIRQPNSMPHIKDVFLAFAAIPFIYYLISIYSSWRWLAAGERRRRVLHPAESAS